VESRLLSYVYCFNVTRDYFLCHEYGESLWLDSGRPVVLKGLIQAAVCLYHLQNGNVRGGHAMWTRAKSYLSLALPAYEGIDLAALIHDIDAVFARVPAALYGRMVTPDAIERLALPVVSVRLTDPDDARALSVWRPEPLPE
jgi:predicted metal-dependent hydrolase